MLKKLGLQTKHNDPDDMDTNQPPSRPFVSTNQSPTSFSSSFPSSAPTSPGGVDAPHSKGLPLSDKDKEKRKAAHNKKGVRALSSFDSNSLGSPSLAPRPHLPSSVYNPNPFPLDPTQPDGVSRINQFVRKDHDIEPAIDVDNGIDETRGFMSGKEKKGNRTGEDHMDHHHHHDNNDSKHTIQKLGAGLKGVLAKSGLGGGKSKEKVIPEDVILAQHQRQFFQQEQEQQQRQQQQQQAIETAPSSSRQMAAPRGRERARTQSGSGNNSKQLFTIDPRSQQRLQSLSPPRLHGQEYRLHGHGSAGDSDLYRPEAEQMRPFLGSHQHPPVSSSSYARESGRYQSPPVRPLSQHNDSDYSDYMRGGQTRGEGARGQRYRSRERNDHDNAISRDVVLGNAGRGGGGGQAGGQVRRQSGLNHATNAAVSVGRTSSEYDEESSRGINVELPRQQQEQQRLPTAPADRLSRAKDWVANHGKASSLALQHDGQRERGGLIGPTDYRSPSTPGSFPMAVSGGKPSHHRLSMDSDENYALITPPRGGYITGTGGRHDARGRMAMLPHMQMHGLQRSRNSMAHGDDDGRYWGHQLEGYSHRDRERERYRSSRPMDYEYVDQYHVGGGESPGAGFYGYPPGGPDDLEEGEGEEDAESTLAPGSAVGLPGKTSKKGVSDKKTMEVVPEGDPLKDEEAAALDTTPKVPNKRRLVLRLISLVSSFFVIVFLIAAAPVSKNSAPWTSKAGLAMHYIVAILSTLVSCAFVFNYFSRRLRRREKMKRYILFGLDIFMTLAWLIDAFVCIAKFPCAVGGQGGWCDMYNTSVFLGIVALISFMAAFVWDIWGSFDHSNLIGKGPIMKPPPPGFYKNDKRAMATQGVDPARAGGVMPGGGGVPGGWPGQGVPGMPGLPGMGRGGPSGKKNKALW
ncbi:hypothetical protein BG004_000632 [Podila humilis]|nr:hypothetical protein BG004_000632 [Podila humilis]